MGAQFSSSHNKRSSEMDKVTEQLFTDIRQTIEQLKHVPSGVSLKTLMHIEVLEKQIQTLRGRILMMEVER
jgi:hypothetical protein